MSQMMSQLMLFLTFFLFNVQFQNITEIQGPVTLPGAARHQAFHM